MNKYNAHKFTYNGDRFDSKRELARYKELSLMEQAGQISGLKRQVKIEILET